MLTRPALGFGLGLRVEHYEAILAAHPPVDWFEVLTENYLVAGGKPLDYLMRLRERYPLAMHGVSLSIGSTAPLNDEYLRQRESARRACRPGVDLRSPVLDRHRRHQYPRPAAAALHRRGARACRRARAHVQDVLGRRILLENVSSYVTFRDSRLTEWEFLAQLAARADCLILLDVNNIYVSAVNHEFDPLEYLDAIPAARVQQIHLAGHENHGGYLVDTHDHPVADPVWELYATAVRRFGPVRP